MKAGPSPSQSLCFYSLPFSDMTICPFTCLKSQHYLGPYSPSEPMPGAFPMPVTYFWGSLCLKSQLCLSPLGNSMLFFLHSSVHTPHTTFSTSRIKQPLISLPIVLLELCAYCHHGPAASSFPCA